MRNIEKTFPSLKALDSIELNVEAGEVRALVGMNGAGKSTLIKILSGALARDSGDILIDGEEVHITNPTEAMHCGIATVYQDPELVQTFTGYENLYLGNEKQRLHAFTRVARRNLKERSAELLREFPLSVDLSKTADEMATIDREIVSVLRALAKRSKILLLDEPTSILTEKEKKVLFEVIKHLTSTGVSILYVTHRLDEINEICDSVSVLRDGRNVTTLRVDDGLDQAYIAELMLGRKLEALYPAKEDDDPGAVLLQTVGLTYEDKFRDVSLVSRENEILGIFGLVGSGIDELSKVLFGALTKTSGELVIDGKPVNTKSPKAAIRANVFLIPGDRHAEGMIGEQSIAGNVTIANIAKVSTRVFGVLRKGKERRDVLGMIDSLSIATPDEKKKVGELSGGNQQKVVVAKGLFTDAKIYIFCEPTSGVDVGTKFSIYQIMRDLAKTAGVILISSDCEEVFGMADRIMVLNRGEMAMEAQRDDVDLREMFVCAAGSQMVAVSTITPRDMA